MLKNFQTTGTKEVELTPKKRQLMDWDEGLQVPVKV